MPKFPFIALLLPLFLLFTGCKGQQPEPEKPTPWGDDPLSLAEGEAFDLEQIEASGEMIMATLSGPDTYYDYHGRQLGVHYLLAQSLADSLGVRLRVDICRDTTELLQRITLGDADLVAMPLPRALADSIRLCGMGADTAAAAWAVGTGKEHLAQLLDKWYTPARLNNMRRHEDFLLSAKSVKRRVFSPMLNRQQGVISHYDAFFQKYSQPLRWDWRLMAAQCYQESTFDPKATSWAGAKGLMQIMPTTADHLGLSRDKMYDPESSIAAAARYLGELDGKFSDIADRRERTNFVLASYNGGYHHIRDAMALAERDGHDHRRWRNVADYVLRLREPKYYQDPLVKHGYMRGTETVDYVQKIIDRYHTYRGMPSVGTNFHNTPQRAKGRGGSKYAL